MLRSVLLVDDDVRLCDMLREYMARRSLSVAIEHYGQKGLTHAREHPPDLMLLDITLPDMDGFEVLRAVRRESNLPVLLLSARGEASDRIHGLHLGADDYVPKPFDPEELVARIEAVLRRGSRQAEQPAGSRVALGGWCWICALVSPCTTPRRSI